MYSYWSLLPSTTMNWFKHIQLLPSHTHDKTTHHHQHQEEEEEKSAAPAPAAEISNQEPSCQGVVSTNNSPNVNVAKIKPGSTPPPPASAADGVATTKEVVVTEEEDTDQDFLDLSNSSSSSSSSSGSSVDTTSAQTRRSAYSRILENEDLQDVLLVGCDNTKVPANRAVLASKSRIFRRLLLNSFRQPVIGKDGTTTVFQMNHFRGDVLQALVEYILLDGADIIEKAALSTLLEQQTKTSTTINNHSHNIQKKKKRQSSHKSHQSSSSQSVRSVESQPQQQQQQDCHYVALSTYRYSVQEIRTLVSLTRAAVYFQLPILKNQAYACLYQLLHSFPDTVFAVLEACRQEEEEIAKAIQKEEEQQQQEVVTSTQNVATQQEQQLLQLPKEVQGLVQSCLRNFMGPLEASSVGFLSPAVVSDIVRNDKLRMSEYQLLELLKFWVDGDNDEHDDVVVVSDEDPATGQRQSTSQHSSLVSSSKNKHNSVQMKPNNSTKSSKTDNDRDTTIDNTNTKVNGDDEKEKETMLENVTIETTAESPITKIDTGIDGIDSTKMETNSNEPLRSKKSTDAAADDTSNNNDNPACDRLDLSIHDRRAPRKSVNRDSITISTFGTSCSYPTFTADIADRKTMVTEHFIHHLRLEFIDPYVLATSSLVTKSGLVPPHLLLNAFRKQAVAAQQFHGITFARPRNRLACWKRCMSEVFTSRDDEFKQDMLNYPNITRGMHQWTVLIEESGDCTWLGLSMTSIMGLTAQAAPPLTTNEDTIQNRNWVYSNHGDVIHGGKRFGEEEPDGHVIPGFGSGSQVTLTLNLMSTPEIIDEDDGEYQGDGQLSASIDGGPTFVLFRGLRAKLTLHPGEGFLPSVSMYTPGRVRLLDIRQLRV